MNKTQIIEIRDDILTTALPDIAFDGWTWDIITRAGEKCGHTENTVRAVFPNTIIDILEHFANQADREMLKSLESINPDDLRIRDRIETALMARYTFLAQHQEAFRNSLKHWINPLNKAKAAKITWRTADTIWNWAGDTSTDYNHYTKRGLLSGIIASSTLVFTNDRDEKLTKTHQFVTKRIENVMQFGKIAAKIKEKVKKPS